MAASKAAIRYATALLDLAKEMKLEDKINDDVLMLDNICENNREFKAFIDSPIIQTRKKVKAYDALFEGKTDPMTLKFLKLVTKNGRENLLPEITESFIDQYRKYKGILDVHVKSAVPLEQKVKDSIIAKINTHFSGEIVLHESVDDSLVGGFVVRIEDKQIDASIKNQLANLKNILLN